MIENELAESLSLQPESILTAAPALLAPLFPLAAALLPGFSQGGKRTVLMVRASLLSLAAALSASVLVMLRGESHLACFQVDALTAVMLPLVCFLAAVVTRYSGPYLAGDPGQNRFTKWLGLTFCSVLTLILAGNLLLFALAWAATSLSLHRLLTFYRDRPAARLAANKKFLSSRLGDLCLAASLVPAWQSFGTWDFREMFAASAGSGVSPTMLAFLLVFAALLKSAQFPFHTWLPDTMETPTPVSALMHAGIINAGGFLVLRLSPLLVQVPVVMDVLAITGAFTALFASLVMLPQTSVKRSLAYSTIAQMGFMMLECGLGAFALAALHIVAHSLYKAHAFLSSGSVVAAQKTAWKPTERRGGFPIILPAILAAASLTWAAAAWFRPHPPSDPGVWLLGSIFVMGLASFLRNVWSASRDPVLIAHGLLAGGAAAVACFGAHALFERMLAGVLPDHAPQRSPFEILVLAGIAVLFLTVMALQARLASGTGNRHLRALHVHLANGFYLGEQANRWTARIFRTRARPL
ncbi:MAG: NADH-quinone oxidoreductase subunit L [Verrucomicrobia bacterium]|nr:NADH-quinone oxidoreductase subunit L [Verrucomicrobiota bacterium]